jgi:hypothetical protein
MTPRLSLPILAFALCGACATAGPPVNEKATSSSATIRAAEEVGAQHSPNAALYLQLAKEQFEHARLLTDPEDKDAANRLLLRAQADADLSLALARSETEKTEAHAAIDRMKTLKSTTIQ